MGFRTHRWGPVTITRRGASHGPGVPPPTAAKFQVHHAYRAIPAAMTTVASHATGTGVCPPRVKIRQGTQTPPRPGTATVNSRLRMTRLSVRAMAAHAPSMLSGRAGQPADPAPPAPAGLGSIYSVPTYSHTTLRIARPEALM